MWEMIAKIAMQLVQKRQAEQKAKKDEQTRIYAEEAQKGGADTSATQSAIFQRKLKNTDYATPQQLTDIYKGSDTATPKSKPGILDAWNSNSTTTDNDDLLDPWSSY